MRRVCMLLGVVVLIGLTVVVSQTFAAAADKPAAKASADHKAAAMELLETMKLDQLLTQTIDTMLDAQVQQNPQIAPYKKVMKDFFKKYMSWAALKDDMAALYAEEFSAGELKELTAFYKTPLGQKLASKQGQLMTKGAALGQRRVQEHMPELQQAIAAEAQKNAGKQ